LSGSQGSQYWKSAISEYDFVELQNGRRLKQTNTTDMSLGHELIHYDLIIRLFTQQKCNFTTRECILG